MNFVIGKIINMHGIKGEFKVYPETDDETRFELLESVIVKGDTYEIESVRYHKGCVLLKLKGIDSIGDGEKLKGSNVEIPEEDAMPLEDDEYYIRDLYDMKVLDIDSGEEIGTLTDVLFTAANDVYEVTDKEGKKYYIPNIKECILDVDTESKVMKIKKMPGLFD